MTMLDIDTPPRVLSTTPRGEVVAAEATTVALYGWELAANARDTARLATGPGNDSWVHVDAYPATGDARGTIVFVGGLSNHALGYADFCWRLSQRGWNVVGVDLRGHGRSSGKRGDFTIAMVIEDIALAAAYAKDRFGTDVGVMGSSLGGFYALCAANAIDGLACAVSHWIFLPNEPMTKKDARVKPVALLLNRIAPGIKLPTTQVADWDGVCDDPALRKACFDDPLMVWKYTIRSLASGFKHDPELPLTQLRIPHLVVTGEEDRMTPAAYTRKIYEQLIGPKEWATIPGAGHMGGLVEHQSEMLDTVDGFLSRTLARVPAAHV